MRFFVEENNLNAVVQWYATYPNRNKDGGFDLRSKILEGLKELYLRRLADFDRDPIGTAEAAAFECVYGPIFAYPDCQQRTPGEPAYVVVINLYVRPRLYEPRVDLLEVDVG